jgi:hypothetical protein
MATFSEVKEWLIKFSQTHQFTYNQAFLEEKKKVLMEFANYVSTDYRKFKISMVAIDSLKSVKMTFEFLTRLHRALIHNWYFEHVNYNSMFDKTTKKHLHIMSHRVMTGNE